MKQVTGLMLFVKYPYAAAIIATIWIASAYMVHQSENMPALPVIIINMVVSWILMAISFRASSS